MYMEISTLCLKNDNLFFFKKISYEIHTDKNVTFCIVYNKCIVHNNIVWAGMN